MDFLPKNKWLGLIVFILIIVVVTSVMMAVVKVIPDPKDPTKLKLSLKGNTKKQNAAATN